MIVGPNGELELAVRGRLIWQVTRRSISRVQRFVYISRKVETGRSEDELVWISRSTWLFAVTIASIALPHGCSPMAAAETPQPATDFFGDPLPDGALLRLGSLRFRHPATVVGMALSPDNKSIVTIGDNLIAWDAATGKERWRASRQDFEVDLPAAAYGMRAITFAPDGSKFYTPGREREVLVWDVFTGERHVIVVQLPARDPAVKLGGLEVPVRAIDVSFDGKHIAVGSAAGTIVCDANWNRQFEVTNKPEAPILPRGMNRDRLLFGGHYSYGVFSPDAKLLAAVTSDGPSEIKLLDAETGEEQRKVVLQSRLVRFTWSPEVSCIVVTERDNAVRMYDVNTGRQVWSRVVKLTNPYENYTSAVAFDPSGKLVAVCATDNLIHLFHAETGDEAGSLRGHSWYPWNLAFNTDGSVLYSAGWDGHVRRWNMASREQIKLAEGIRATGVVAISPESTLLAYEDDDGKVRLVDSATGNELRVFTLADTSYSELTFSPDSRQLAGGGTHGDQVHVAIWDVDSGELLQRWDWPKGRDPHSTVGPLQYAPDGQRLAAAVFRQDAVYWWDLKTFQPIAQKKHEEVYGLSFSPDGQTLATVGWDSTIRLWEPATGTLRQEIDISKGNADDLRMYAVCYASKGGFLATQHMNGQVWIWDAASMKVQRKFRPGQNFGAMSFSPDGFYLATGTRNGVVSLWETFTGEEAKHIDAHQDDVGTLGFGGDGRVLVSGGGDGVCYLWNLHPPAFKINKPLPTLWADLSAENASAAYSAMWAMAADPDRAVPFLAEKLRGLTNLIDPDEVEAGVSQEEGERRRRLQRVLIERDPKIERRIVAQRAIWLLARINSKETMQLLRQLTAENPEGDVAKIAAAALGAEGALHSE
jgi:WD40 repeat protein